MRVRGVKRLRHVARTLKNRFVGQGLILLYHRVGDVGSDPWMLNVRPDNFKEQLQIMREVARPLTLNQLVQILRKGKTPHRALAVTFDDGYANNLYNAKPLLEHYDIPATVFIATGFTDQNREFWWDELERVFLHAKELPTILDLEIRNKPYHAILSEGPADRSNVSLACEKHKPTARQSAYQSVYKLLHPLPLSEKTEVLEQLVTWASDESSNRANYRPLATNEILKLADGGLVDIGAHTVTHPVLSSQTTAVQSEEIRQSKAHLEQIMGRAVTSFAYPHGQPSDYTLETATLVREAGFASACVASRGSIRGGTDLFHLPRLHVQDWDGEEFRKVLFHSLYG